MEYAVKTKSGERWTVTADNYREAAAIALMEMNRDARGRLVPRLVAERTTGERDKSGWFQGYKILAGGDMNSFGEAFHVM